MLADTAIAGRSSYVVSRVRRFLCSNSGCDRRTFVEQIDGLTILTRGVRTDYSAAARGPGEDCAGVGRASRIEVGAYTGSFRRTLYLVTAGSSVARPSNRCGDGAWHRRLRSPSAASSQP
ncbi:hypothetical protein [Rhodococcus erythropolis]|uniref:hypothetical protein n=1 Tax=Rhodococcus erythropolis TaxID=1833 RepID=UPI00211F040A|nr:hypothetical protein [Rhodococcus erythropolis]